MSTEGTPQPAKRGRGRPRKYPLPEGYKPFPPKPKATKLKKTNLAGLDIDNAVIEQPRGKRRAASKRVVYTPDVDATAMAVDDEEFDVAAINDDNDDEDDEEVEIEDEEEEDDDVIEEASEEEVATKRKYTRRSGTPVSRSGKFKGLPPTRSELELELLKAKTKVPPFVQARSGPNLKARLLRMHGFNTDVMAKIINSQKKWRMFGSHVSDTYCAEVEVFPEDLETIKIPSIKYTPITPLRFTESLNLGQEFGISFNNESATRLMTFDSVPLPSVGSRSGRVLNTGSLPLEVSWMQGVESTQYLFVSVLSPGEGVVREELAYVSDTTCESGLLVYKVTTTEVELAKSILLPFGAMTNMKWSPSKTDTGSCALGAIFSDGSCRIFKFDAEKDFESKGDSAAITDASVTFQLPGQRITSFDWISESRLLVGTSDGAIAEFSLFETQPAYVYQLNVNRIVRVVSNISDYIHEKEHKKRYGLRSDIVVLSTLDFTNVAVDLKTLQQMDFGNTPPKLFTRQVVYSPLIDMFLYEDGTTTLRMASKKLPSHSYALVSHDAVASAIAVSALHPLILTSASDGSLLIFNPTPKLAAPAKSSAVSVCAHILKLDYTEATNSYRISTAQNMIAAKKENSRFSVDLFPVGINLHSVAWNGNPSAGGWYAACSPSGLVVVEKIVSAELA